MRTIRVLPMCLMASTMAHAGEDVRLGFAWEDGAAWRTVIQWQLDLVDPDEETTSRSGVVREVWRWNVDEDGHVLAVEDTTTVRASPREDALAQRIGQVWQAERRVEVRPEEAAPELAELPPDAEAEASPEDGETPDAASAEDGTEAAPTDETATDAPPPAAQTEAEPDAQVEADKVVRRVPDLVKLTTARLEHGVVGLLQRLDTAEMTLDEPKYFTLPEGREVWTLSALPSCPSVGPGSTCVSLHMKSYLANAPDDGSALEAGQARFEATWTLEPDTLVVHHADIQGTVAFEDNHKDGKGLWHAKVSRTLDFLNLTPPAELPEPSAE